MATAIPDLAAALKLRLVSFAAITTLAPSNRILLTWPKKADGSLAFSVPPFFNLILIQTGRGGPGELPAARMAERVDISCYGPDERTANLLWRTVHYALCPPMGSARANSFRISSDTLDCQVNTLQLEGGPNRLVDPDLGWPYCQASYIVDYKAF